MNLIIQYGLLGLVLGLGLGLGFILYCRIWRPLALPYMCPQPKILDSRGLDQSLPMACCGGNSRPPGVSLRSMMPWASYSGGSSPRDGGLIMIE